MSKAIIARRLFLPDKPTNHSLELHERLSNCERTAEWRPNWQTTATAEIDSFIYLPC
ncbi:MAG: hypothetical protein P8N76_13780 [Pirellulaceae bacterium]|nr:hypothetical protein [Pirellulaceae bacterium]